MILKEELTKKDVALLDKLAGIISAKYANEFGISRDDLYQDLILAFYSKWDWEAENVPDFISNNKTLIDKGLERVAIDNYRYNRRRYDSQVAVTDTAQYDKGMPAGKMGARQRFDKTDESVAMQEIFRSLKKKFGKYSYELRYFTGMAAVEGVSQHLKRELSSDDWKMLMTVKDKNGVAWYMDPDEGMDPSYSKYKSAAKRVRDHISSIGYKI